MPRDDDKDRGHLWIPGDDTSDESYEPSGGGQSISRDDYTSHGQKLRNEIDSLRVNLDNKADRGLLDNVVIEVRTLEEYKIRHFRSKLKELGLAPISYSIVDPSTATVEVGERDLRNLRERIDRYTTEPGNPGRSSLSVLEEIGPVPIQRKMDPSLREAEDEVIKCIITLYDVFTEKKKKAIAENISQTLAFSEVEEFDYHLFPDGTFAIATRAPVSVMRSIGERYIAVKSISPNNSFIVKKSVRGTPFSGPVSRAPVESNAVVAVVDSGVSANLPSMRGLVTGRILNPPPGSVGLSLDHGTFVASRIIYGDSIPNMVARGSFEPKCRVLDITVFGVLPNGDVVGLDDLSLSKVLHQAIPSLPHDVRVVNLSLGAVHSITDGSYSLLATQCDYLAKKHDLVFVIAAGNIDETLIVNPPNHFISSHSRIQPPAESILSLSVGSIAKNTSHGCHASSDEVSVFSCRGPGSDLGIKPELVTHGGNTLPRVTPPGVTYTGQIASYGLHHSGGHLAFDVGTSFSAPIVSQFAARLFAKYPSASANLIKALLINSAQPRSFPAVGGLGHQEFCGFGEPHFDIANSSGSNYATFLFEGDLLVNTYKHIHFHVPSALASDSIEEKVRVTVTVVFDPPVNPNNPVEYCSTRISTSLYKNYTGGDPSDPDTYRQVSPDGDADFYKEWSPVMRIQKEFKRSYFTGLWKVRLRLWSRDNVPDTYRQNYAVVVQVEDTAGKIDVYDEVLKETGSRYSLSIQRAA